MDDRLEVKTEETKTSKYVVKIEMGYREARFEFNTPEEACHFMTMAATSNVKVEDKVTISMSVKDEEEEDEE